ncbi:MAG TPA: FadD3 family acyl-CoA ligase [Pseudonocardiaceae bacterium]|nr:FadD3 family acyl-CoA ligase [Pseudonocardiaceae bacterium]
MATTTTVPAALARAAERFGDGEALVDPNGAEPVRLSWRALLAETRVVARMFTAQAVRPGDRVAICAPNTAHWALAALGALSIGATLVPINTRFTGPEMLDIIRRTKAVALVVAGPFLGVDRLTQLRSAAAELPGTDTDPVPGVPHLRTVLRVPVEPLAPEPKTLAWSEIPALAAAVAEDTVEELAAAVQPDQIADILFTSGTTGRSKGAMSAHRQSLAVAQAWAARGELTAEDRYLVINPFFHSFGYKAGILACVHSGATIVPQPVFDVARAAELVESERISVLPGPPTIYQSIMDDPELSARKLDSLRLAVTGAATVPVALIERMRRELSFRTVLTAYGLTEAVVATMCVPGDDPDTVARTSGRPTADFDLRIGDSGEILLRGPNVMLGYLDDPQATAQAVDAQGWLHTGDVGTVDEQGYLTITDRLKDMYICGGFNVYPAEVEQVLATLPGVAECAVIGVPDTRMGEVGRAYLVPGPHAQLSTADVIGFCRERLANYKVPRQVELRDQLPHNASGKILKRLLREENGT